MCHLPIASVVLCTRDRSGTLAQACESLLAIDFPPHHWELLIVDNGSTDNSVQVARAIQDSRPQTVRVIEETEIGLSVARNTGVREARGRVVAFADDDVFVDRAWLSTLVEALEQRDVLVAGGPVEPIFLGQLPSWFSPRFLPYLAAWDRGSAVHSLSYNDYPRGANIAFRREAFERFGYFSRHLGRTAGSLLSCEETEICLRIERGGGRILYSPTARVRHLTATDRITPTWLSRRFFAQGRSEAIVEWRHAGWRGLYRGWLRSWRMKMRANRDSSLSPGGPMYARLVRHTLLGHTSSVLVAPYVVPRYHPAPGTPASRWLPSAQG
jgi:glycosyltransferase involved in cell wall biosynthesis